MKAYSEYKDSGVEWLGDIPKHWEVAPCRAIVENVANKNEDGAITNYLSLMANIGIIRYEDKGDIGNKKPDDLSKCKIVRKGNLVINSMNYAIGSYGISPYDGICSPVYIVLKTKTQRANNRYTFWLFDNKPMQKHFALLGNGILEHRAAIKWDDIKPQHIAIPPINEQKIIAQFLDHETARIDKLIAEKQTFIDLLNEKRQALISHIVTKGLNPNVKMKDSGIEWIGEIPEHWNITRLRYVGRCQNGISISGEMFGEGSPFISYSDVYKNRVLPDEVSGLVLSSDKDKITYSVKKGDVFFTRTSETIEEIGFSSVCKKTIEHAVFAGFLIRLRPIKELIYIDYSEYYFQNQKMRAFFVKEMNLVTRASLSQELLKKMPILLPSLAEQKQISMYLSKKVDKINQLIIHTEKSIYYLQEYRTSLIGAAVTGKIDIRDYKEKSYE